MTDVINRTTDGDGLGVLLALPAVPAPEFAGWRPGAAARPRGTSREAATRAGQSVDALGEAELRYLRAVIDRPGRPSSVYPKLAGISPRRALEIRDRLVELGYLRPHRVSTSGRGRASIVLEPLEPAHRAVGASTQREAR